MPISIQPTFNCLAVKNASEMGPHREPRLRAAMRRRRGAKRERLAAEPRLAAVVPQRSEAMEERPAGEPRLLAAMHRWSAAREERRGTRNRRAARAAWVGVQERQRILVLGDRRSQVDRVALVAMVGLVAVVLGFVAARL